MRALSWRRSCPWQRLLIENLCGPIQVAKVVVNALDERRAMHPPQAGADEEGELAEEWSPEELSNAALLASSVLTTHGSIAGQVSIFSGVPGSLKVLLRGADNQCRPAGVLHATSA